MLQHFKTRPRLSFSIITGFALWLLLPEYLRATTRLVLAWDCVAGLYLTLVAWMMYRSTTETIRLHAEAQDEGRLAILSFTTLAAIASLAAIVAELSTAKEFTGLLKAEHIALAGVTVFLSWAFLHTMYALHYAHEFYTDNGEAAEGLEFPGHCHKPDYWDFVYYSFVIGTSTATADINITSASIRRITTLHCMIAFFFNTTILALTVNIGAGLF